MMGFGLAGILLMVLFWIALIFLAVWVVKVLFSDRDRHQPDRRVLDLARGRSWTSVSCAERSTVNSTSA